MVIFVAEFALAMTCGCGCCGACCEFRGCVRKKAMRWYFFLWCKELVGSMTKWCFKIPRFNSLRTEYRIPIC